MKVKISIIAAMVAATVLASAPALAQPETKLTRNLAQATIKAVWCSALFLEEFRYWNDWALDLEDGDEDKADYEDTAAYYEDMAYELGGALDDVMREAGLPTAESEEVWTVFDDAAADFAAADEETFYNELDSCEAAYIDGKLKLQ